MRDAEIIGMKSGAPSWQPESPFQDAGRSVVTRDPAMRILTFSSESPFVNEVDERFAPPDPAVKAVNGLLSELHDPEFDVAVYEVVHELSSGLATARFTTEVGDPRAYEARVERVLAERLAPIERAYHEQLDELGERLAPLDTASLSETELEALVERVSPPTTTSGPAFEFFLKKLWEKAKKVVKGAVKVVKAVALGPLFAGLKKIIHPILKKVLAMAMDKIPEKYRPLAEKLAQKFGVKRKPSASAAASPALSSAGASGVAASSSAGATGADATTGADAARTPAPSAAVGTPGATPSAPGDDAAPAAPSTDPSAAGAAAPAEPATAAVTEVQNELDGRIGEMLLAKDETEREMALAAQEAEAARPPHDPVGELEQSRAHFVRAIARLKEGEDPLPAMENFIPAIFAAVKLGLKLIGRKRVVSFVGGLLAKLIGPLVGKGLANPLGSAIADIGMKLLGFELPATEQAEAGARAIAEMVEGTLRRIAAAPAYVHENEALLESHTLEAFEAEAAACLPPSMIRPELREADDVEGMWVPIALRGRPYYKKFSRVFDIEITRPIAATVRGFQGTTLEAFLRDRLHLSFPVRARAHLFQVMPGGRLAHIAERERARGLGRAEAYGLIHPLTNHAAAVLLHHPRLGTPFEGTPDPLRAMVGQRYFFLEIEPSASLALGPGAMPELGRASHLQAHVDFPRSEIRVRMHVGEPAAQSIATELRRTRRGAALVHRLRQLYTSAAAELASARNEGLLRITVDPPGPDERASLAAVARDGQQGAIRREIGAKLMEWTWIRLAEYAEQKADDFVRAAEEPENGVTVLLTFHNPPRMTALRHALRGGVPSTDDRWPPRETPVASIRVFAGFRAD